MKGQQCLAQSQGTVNESSIYCLTNDTSNPPACLSEAPSWGVGVHPSLPWECPNSQGEPIHPLISWVIPILFVLPVGRAGADSREIVTPGLRFSPDE